MNDTEARLQERIVQDLKKALKTGEKDHVNTLRMLQATISNARLALKDSGDVSEQEMIALIRKEIKKREDAEGAFRQAGRTEHADQEAREKEILSSYLPPDMSDDELKVIIERAITVAGASSQKDIGKVMGVAMKEINGSVSGTRVREIAQELLTNPI